MESGSFPQLWVNSEFLFFDPPTMITVNGILTFLGDLTQGLPQLTTRKQLLNVVARNAQCSEATVGNAMLLTTFATLGSLTGMAYGSWLKKREEAKKVDFLLNSECGLATDWLENATSVTDFEEVAVKEPAADRAEHVATKVVHRRGVAVLNMDKVQVKGHRKVRPGKQMPYMNCLIAECKVKFGVPTRNEANVLAVRRYVASLMTSHGVRPSHMAVHIPMIVAMVFVPSEAELESLALMNSAVSNSRKVEYLLGVAKAGLKTQC